MKGILVGLAVAAGLAFIGQARATTVTFDNINLTQNFSGVTWDVMPSPYGGLTWQTGSPEPTDSWEVVKMDNAWRSYYSSSMTAQSGDQAAYNGGTAGWASSLYVEDGSFKFMGAYFLSWPNNAQGGANSITATGYLNNVAQGSATISLSPTSWTWLDGSSLGTVDKVVFSDGLNHPWLMDNLQYSVPEGGVTVMLLGLGMLAVGWARRMVK